MINIDRAMSKRKSMLFIRFKMIKIEADYRRDLYASYLIIMDDWQ